MYTTVPVQMYSVYYSTINNITRLKSTRLTVPIHDVVVVEILQPQNDASCVEARPALAKHVRVDVHHEVPSRGVLHHKTHVGVRLRGAITNQRLIPNEVLILSKIIIYTSRDNFIIRG